MDILEADKLANAQPEELLSEAAALGNLALPTAVQLAQPPAMVPNVIKFSPDGRRRIGRDPEHTYFA